MIELFALLFPYLWAGTPETGYHQVWLYEVDSIDWCGNDGVFTACYTHDISGHRIDFARDSNPFERDAYNCNTVWTHEALHAWGYNHGERPLSIC